LLAKAGFDVVREYYINDAGAQVDVLARSAYHRYREALGDDMGAVPAGLYPGDYLVPLGQDIAKRYGDIWRNADEAVWLETIRTEAVAAMLVLIKEDLAALGVKHDLFSSERAMVESGAVEASLAALEERGLIYVGTLEPPKGKTPDEWEPRPQTLFRATDFGDDVDRPLKKSDGSWTYFANDIAYHYDKALGNPHRPGANILINIFGADHGGYVKRMMAAVKALTDGKVALDIKLCQLVNLLDNGVPVKMSKRAGNFVILREVVDEVGANAVRFIMLTRKNDVSLDFDFAKVQEQSKDNPVFYVQYAHARAASVLRNAVDSLSHDQLSSEHLANSSLSHLTDEAELGLMRTLASWPRLVEAAAEAHEPHRIAFYLGDVAAGFHALWNKGRDEASLRFILPDDPELTIARLALVQGVKSVIASGLAVLGVEPVEEMR
jgi:arginyl-tRNA synthetase